jgi:hypothetical protein
MKMLSFCVCLWFMSACAKSASESEATRTSDAGELTPGRADAATPPPIGDAGEPQHPSMVDSVNAADAAPAKMPPSAPPTNPPEEDAGTSSPPKPGETVAGSIDKVDLLFVVDNTNSMLDEQAALQAAFPRLIDALTMGVVSTGKPMKFPGVRDLHVGVVSTDMGISGAELGSCHANGGDDGRLQHTAHGASCAPSYPSFLSYDALSKQDAAQFAADFACIAHLGTGGCGFEQSLEAPLKALWPSTFTDASGKAVAPNPITFLSNTSAGTLGRGDMPAADGGSLGFLRNDRSQGRSLIAIVVVTDEDDCSVRDSTILYPPSMLGPDSPYRTQDINLRCHDNPSALFDVERYVRGFRALREDEPTRVVFAAITGVPNDLVDAAALSAVDFGAVDASDAFYDHVLSDPRMQETVDPSTKPGTGTGDITPSCKRVNAAGKADTAAPPRRIVQVAKKFGAQGIVQSLCQDDLTPAIDAIVGLIGKQIAASHP